MRVAIQFTDGERIIIKDVYELSTIPDDFFVRISHYRGDIIINRSRIKLIERFYGEDSNKEDNKNE